MKVLLSIKPEFVERIFDGSKKYEYRKMLFKRNDINVVVIYASAPVKRVVGEFRIKDIFSESVDVLWERTKEYSGISREYYLSYFQHKNIANAIEIGKIKKYKKIYLDNLTFLYCLSNNYIKKTVDYNHKIIIYSL